MSRLVIVTPEGRISLALHAGVAPETVKHVVATARSGAFDGAAAFYRSDFVIQCGLHGTGRAAPLPPLAVNESGRRGRLTNARGAAALAHWDAPDNGNTELFISVRDNPHLDAASGGFCVFAAVAPGDTASFAVVDAIAAAVAGGRRVPVTRVDVE